MHKNQPAPLRNLLTINRKVPLTSFETALGFAAGPATGTAAVENLKPFTIPGTQARLGFATSLPAFTFGPAKASPCKNVAVTYMRCLSKLGANVLIQADANDGEWTGDDGNEPWQPLSWMGSAYRAVSDPTVHFDYAVNPMMVGNLADTPFDGQSAILERGRKGNGCQYVGNASFVPGQDLAQYRSYAGAKPQFLALAPWAVADGPRVQLKAVGNALAAGTGPHRYVQTAVIADLPFPVDRRRARLPDRGPMTNLSRRQVLTGAAGTAAGALLAGAGDAEAARKPAGKPVRSADVIVIGAGLAGLTTASDLVQSRHSVVVLEARDRVGGRTLNHPVGDGEVIEVGGEWVGPGQDRIQARAKEFGIKTFKTYTKGAQIFDFEGDPDAFHR